MRNVKKSGKKSLAQKISNESNVDFCYKLHQEVKSAGIQHLLNLYKVEKPEHVMLTVIFNLVRGLTQDSIMRERDIDVRNMENQSLAVQEATFSVAARATLERRNKLFEKLAEAGVDIKELIA